MHRLSFLFVLSLPLVFLWGCDLLGSLEPLDAPDGGDSVWERDLGSSEMGGPLDDGGGGGRQDQSSPDLSLQDVALPDDAGRPVWQRNLVTVGASEDPKPWGPDACFAVPPQGTTTVRFLGNEAMEASAVTLKDTDMRSMVRWERGAFELKIVQGRWSQDSWFGGQSAYGRWSGVLDGPGDADQDVTFVVIPRLLVSTGSALALGGWQEEDTKGFYPVSPTATPKAPYTPEASPLALELDVPNDGVYLVSLTAENPSATPHPLALRFGAQRFAHVLIPPDTTAAQPLPLSLADGALRVYLSKGTHTVSLVSAATAQLRIKAVLIQPTCDALSPQIPLQGVFVAPGASKAGADGTLEQPYRFADVLADTQNMRVKPGQTVWLRGGTYPGIFESTLSGTPGKPISFRPYPGEFVRLDARHDPASDPLDEDTFALTIAGDHTSWSDLEVTSSQSEGRRVSDKEKGEIPSGIEVLGQDTTLSSLIVHDLATGIRRGPGALSGLLIQEGLFYNLGHYQTLGGTTTPKSGAGVWLQGPDQADISVRGNLFWGLPGLDAVVARALDGQLSGVRVQGNVVLEQGIAFEGQDVGGEVPGPYTIQDNMVWKGTLNLGLGALHKGALVIENLWVETPLNFGGIASLTLEDNRFLLDRPLPKFFHFTQFTPGSKSQRLIGGKNVSIAGNTYQGGFAMRHGSGDDWAGRVEIRRDFKAWQAGGNDQGVKVEPPVSAAQVVVHVLSNRGAGARYMVAVYLPKAASSLEAVELSQAQIPQFKTGESYRMVNLLSPVEEDLAGAPRWRIVGSGRASFPFTLPLRHLQKAAFKGIPGPGAPATSAYPADPEKDQVFVFLIESL